VLTAAEFILFFLQSCRGQTLQYLLRVFDFMLFAILNQLTRLLSMSLVSTLRFRMTQSPRSKAK